MEIDYRGENSNEAIQRFSQIYRENYAWLSRWLYRNLKASTNLEDLVQDTFLKLFVTNKAHLIREPKAYLATTARGLMIDQIRHSVIERKYLEYLALVQQDEVALSAEQVVASVELLERIAMAISDLPERQRISLLLYYLEGRKQDEIAQRFNVTTRTIQNDLVKAMVHCQQWIEKNA
jgi:RNA polymerase sigma-70 factor (ECF subfamily)